MEGKVQESIHDGGWLVPVVAEDLRVEGEGPEEEVRPAQAQGEIAQPHNPQHPAPGSSSSPYSFIENKNKNQTTKPLINVN